MNRAEMDAVADRLFGGIEAGDIDAVRDLYAPDLVAWNTVTRTHQTREENLATLSWCVEHLGGMRYTDVRRHPVDDGFVEQHILRATAPNGQELVVPACLVVTVVDGRITRLEEYLNAADMAPLLG